MSNPRKRKGSRIEREIRDSHLAVKIPAKKMPLSGALGGEYSGDLEIANSFKAEVKSRKNGTGFAVINKWLGENDFLFVKENHGDVKVVMPMEIYLLLLSTWVDANGIERVDDSPQPPVQ